MDILSIHVYKPHPPRTKIPIVSFRTKKSTSCFSVLVCSRSSSVLVCSIRIASIPKKHSKTLLNCRVRVPLYRTWSSYMHIKKPVNPLYSVIIFSGPQLAGFQGFHCNINLPSSLSTGWLYEWID